MTPPGSLRALITGLIDYAGLFPPASLNMEEAIRNYAAYRHDKYSWALGRFVVPAARLAELDAIARDLPPLRLAALTAPRSVPPDIADVVELKIDSVSEIAASKKLLPDDVTAYYEIPITSDPAEFVAAIADAGGRAKVRTGGVNAEMFPSSADLARFMRRCAAARVAFKATAGLHHPVRSVHRLTYQPNSPSAMMHGFVNVFTAAVSVYLGGEEQGAVRILEEQSADAFHFDDAGVKWRGHQLTTPQIADARRRFAIGFGSCSFEEPITDLQALGFL